ncbi:MAG: fasciclin domain-containing protein [Rhodospirillaceae bacterium]
MIGRLVLFLALALAPLPAGAQSPNLPTKDILGTALDAGTFTIFLAGVKAAGLNDFLAAEGPLTVFAPTDDAFAKLPPGTVQMLLRPENRDRLRALLMHHVVVGRVVARDFLGRRMEAATADGALVLIDATKTVMIDTARLIKADIGADNGIIHVIDTVLTTPATVPAPNSPAAK